MEWLKRLTVDARRDERTIKSALSARSLSGEFPENGVTGNLPTATLRLGEHTKNPTLRAVH
jgi:hypothetical protein